MNTANPASNASVEQFQTFQELIRRGDDNAAAEAGSALEKQQLSPLQRALVLQLQGDLAQAHGEPEAARRCWRNSLQLRFAPELALRLVEQALHPAMERSQRNEWLGLMQTLMNHGCEPQLLRTLERILKDYPLNQQRLELLEMVQQQPSLRPLWQRLQRFADVD